MRRLGPALQRGNRPARTFARYKDHLSPPVWPYQTPDPHYLEVLIARRSPSNRPGRPGGIFQIMRSFANEWGVRGQSTSYLQRLGRKSMRTWPWRKVAKQLTDW